MPFESSVGQRVVPPSNDGSPMMRGGNQWSILRPASHLFLTS